MKLVIVESPTKCHTIGKYLGKDYVVMASLGHIRDLATSGKGGLGVDIEHNFKPTYKVQPKQLKNVQQLKKEAEKAEEVILATDPDREGEAIAWHLADVLGLDIQSTKRLEFHEITYPAIQKALANPRLIDLNLVSSQETRRILDRIIGFRLSNLLQKKIRSRSAGRVQSTSLKLLVDQDALIKAFVSEEYWTFSCKATYQKKKYEVNLISIDGKPVEIHSEKEADIIFNQIQPEMSIKNVVKEEKKKESKPPFTTSTLQQEAFAKYRFSTKKTASVAQKLYEGMNIGEETVGLITYMRTDSTRLSPEFIQSAKEYIVEHYGKEYLGFVKTKKGKGTVQDAHEAIRPTSLKRTPEMVKPYLSNDEWKLYQLIYHRALASLMSAKKDEVTTVFFAQGNQIWKLEGSRPLFLGYDILTKEEGKEKILPEFHENEKVKVSDIEKKQNFTQAPSHYSEAKLVKKMEELGIGRPSTYASTIEILKSRDYVSSEKGILIPTSQGICTISYLQEYFTKMIDPKFTADMEESLDHIVAGSESRTKLLKDFYDEFTSMMDHAGDPILIPEEKKLEETGELCPLCGSKMVFKQSRFGKFEACSNYPKCKYIKKETKQETVISPDAPKCPECGHPLVERVNRKGDHFYGCSNFPKCHYVRGLEAEIKENPTEVIKMGTCPKCGGDLIEKKGRYGNFLGCSNFPKCHYIEKISKKA